MNFESYSGLNKNSIYMLKDYVFLKALEHPKTDEDESNTRISEVYPFGQDTHPIYKFYIFDTTKSESEVQAEEGARQLAQLSIFEDDGYETHIILQEDGQVAYQEVDKFFNIRQDMMLNELAASAVLESLQSIFD